MFQVPISAICGISCFLGIPKLDSEEEYESLPLSDRISNFVRELRQLDVLGILSLVSICEISYDIQ